MEDPSPPSPGVQPHRLALSGGRTVVLGGPAKRGCVHIQISDTSGKPCFRHADWPVGNPTARRRVEREVALTPGEVLQIENEAITLLAELEHAEKAAKAEDSAPAQMIVTVHSQDTGEQFEYPVSGVEGVIAIMRRPVGPSVFMRWTDPKQAVNVDADFHGKVVPDANTLDRLMRDLKPAPRLIHRTTRGFHAIYGAMDGYTAEELGCLAAATLQTNDTVLFYEGTVEILTRTRHPGSVHHGKIYGPLTDRVPDTHAPILAIFDDRSCTPDERLEVQDLLDLRLGRRFPHSACVIEPGHASTGEPVVVTEHGLFCHSCAGRLNHGLTTWSQLRRMNGLKTATDGDTQPIRDAIQRLTPHTIVARYLEAIAPHVPPRFHRTLHIAMLKRLHGTDPETMLLINGVFAPWTLARSPTGKWIDTETLRMVTPRPDRAVFNHCSATQVVMHNADGDPVVKPDPARVTALVLDGTTPRGFTPLIATAQSPVFHVHNGARITEHGIAARPRDPNRKTVSYVEKAQRIDLGEAMNRIRARWPGISMEYLVLILLARGCAEEGACQLPMLWAIGPTSVGKSATIQIATAMYGETPENLVFGSDGIERVNDMLGRAQSRTSVVTLDEIGKAGAGRDGQRIINNAITWLLQTNRTVQYHHRHVDMVSERVRTVIAITDMRVPEAMRRSEQLGRRVVAVPLTNRVQWDNLKRSGFAGWWHETPELQQAAESLHSHMVDEFFPEGCSPSFIAMAHKLGFSTCADYWGQGTEQEGLRDLVCGFVRALMSAPPASEAYQRVLGVGLVELAVDETTPLAESTKMLCGIFGPEGVTQHTLVASLEPFQPQLHLMLPLIGPAHIDIVPHHRKLFARIRADGARRGKKVICGLDLLKPGVDPKDLQCAEVQP